MVTTAVIVLLLIFMLIGYLIGQAHAEVRILEWVRSNLSDIDFANQKFSDFVFKLIDFI